METILILALIVVLVMISFKVVKNLFKLAIWLLIFYMLYQFFIA